MPRHSGFTLVELLIAGTISAIVALAGFAALTAMQDQASDQRRVADLTSQARLALDLIGRDIRMAGDSQEMLPVHCLNGVQSPGTAFQCSAILDPHPWRVTLTKNTWDPGTDGVLSTMDDRAPQLAFNLQPDNVVTYQFVKTRDVTKPGDAGYRGVLGRLERIVNPFQFAGAQREVTVLLDRVLLDNRMRVNPANPTENDPRYDHSLFMYQVLSTLSGEFEGAAVYTERTTRHGSFLLPPVRFFDPLGTYQTYQAAPPAAPWLPDYGTPHIVGLGGSTTVLLRGSSSFDTDLRFVLDRNRIRAVRVALKVVDPREDPDLGDGIDVDPTRPGTARVFSFETTVELKVFSATLD